MPSTYNGAVLAATGGPTVNDGLMSWYAANGGSGTTLQELERSYLTLATVAPAGLTISDLWRRLGAVQGYTGTVNDIQLNFWLNAGNAPPSNYAYNWTIGQGGTDFGFIGAAGSINPTDWPDVPGRVISALFSNSGNFLFLRTSPPQQQIADVLSVLLEIEGATSGIGPDNNAFTLPWSPNDYQFTQAALRTYIQSKLGQQVGVNMRSFNNNVTIGTNNTNVWGWNNGLGLGALGNTGAGFWNPSNPGVVCVNFFVNAADRITLTLNLGIGTSPMFATVPGLNGGQRFSLPGNGANFTADVAGATALFQQALAANMRLPCILERA